MIAVVAVERIVTIQEISLSASQNTSLNRQQTVSWAVCQGGEYQSTGTLQHCSTAALSAPAADDATAAAALAFHTALKDLMWTLAQDNSICYRFRCVVRLSILECSNKPRPMQAAALVSYSTGDGMPVTKTLCYLLLFFSA